MALAGRRVAKEMQYKRGYSAEFNENSPHQRCRLLGSARGFMASGVRFLSPRAFGQRMVRGVFVREVLN